MCWHKAIWSCTECKLFLAMGYWKSLRTTLNLTSFCTGIVTMSLSWRKLVSGLKWLLLCSGTFFGSLLLTACLQPANNGWPSKVTAHMFHDQDNPPCISPTPATESFGLCCSAPFELTSSPPFHISCKCDLFNMTHSWSALSILCTTNVE